MSQKNVKKSVGAAVAAALIMSAPAAIAGKYMTGHHPTVTVNNYGECWQSAGGMEKMVEKCGDMVAKPAAPAPAPMDKDSDGDGVLDKNDKCPNTRPGAKVDSDGCEIVADITINLVNDEFDFDSAELKPDMVTALDNVADEINASPGNESLGIVGYTDSIGAAEYNQGLSERRAHAVAKHLSGKGISMDRMTVSGMGEENPVADNGTREGRAKNRRVEISTK